jgi:hypothetical protein
MPKRLTPCPRISIGAGILPNTGHTCARFVLSLENYCKETRDKAKTRTEISAKMRDRAKHSPNGRR